MGDAGEPSTLLVHAAALLHGPLQTEPAAANGFNGEDRCGNTRLLVRSATSIKLSVFYLRSKRIDGPPFTHGDHVEMPVEVQTWTRPGTLHPSQHVHARIFFRVLTTTFRRDVVRLVAEFLELAADQFRVCHIVLTRRIHRGNTNEFLQKGNHLRARLFDSLKNGLLNARRKALLRHRITVRGSASKADMDIKRPQSKS